MLPSFLGAPASPICLVHFLVPFCLFFCLECLSLQIFVAERTHSGFSVKSTYAWGNTLLSFWEALHCFFVVVVYQVFLFCFIFVYIFPFYLEGMGRIGNKEVGAAFCLFLKLNYK